MALVEGVTGDGGVTGTNGFAEGEAIDPELVEGEVGLGIIGGIDGFRVGKKASLLEEEEREKACRTRRTFT